MAQLAQIEETGTPQCDSVMESLKSLLKTRFRFLAHPVLLSDLYQLTSIIELCTEYWLSSSSFGKSDLMSLWSIIDLLFNDSIAFMDARNFSRHVFLCL